MHELVIFDCDGVLVDSEMISNEVLARMLTREGLPTTLREARRDYQGFLLSDIQRRAEAKLGRSLPWLAEYEYERAEAFRHGLEPVAGAAEVTGSPCSEPATLNNPEGSAYQLRWKLYGFPGWTCYGTAAASQKAAPSSR